MLESDDAARAEVFDFLNEYLDDLDRGVERPLSEYLARHPDHQEAIAREWIARRHPTGGAPVGGDERSVGPYRLVSELGRGGQGSVWLAEDTRIARRVALKIFAVGVISPERRARLRREAEVIARLDHPGICGIHEAVVDGETPYIAMRYVEGVVLARALERARAGEAREPVAWIPRDRVELERVLRLFERAARALHAAHEAGVVHRDVKPGNLMVTPAGEPVVLDFGLARDESSAAEHLTLSGEVFGTPGYTSPEQLYGSGELDRRTDVWSLGVTLYEALTGERPFRGESRFELERSVVHDPLPDPRAKNPVLGEDVRVVLETALEKDRERRYATALELAEDLRRIREYEPIRARPASAWLRLRRWMQRQPALATSVIGTIVVLATALALTLTLLARVESANQQMEAALSVARGRHLAERALDLLDRDPGLALALAIEAVEGAPTHLTRSALFEVLDACRLERVFVARDAHQLRDIDVVADRIGRLLLAAASDDGQAHVWDLRGGAELARFAHPGEVVRHVALDPAGERLASASSNGTLRLFAVAGGGLAWSRDLAPRDELVWVEFDSAGARLSVLSKESGAWVVDAANGEVLARIDLSASPGDSERKAAGALVFSPDGASLLASGRHSQRDLPRANRAWVFDAVTGEPRFSLAHADAITWAEFDRAGERIATASRDGTARVWDARAGQSLAVPLVHVGIVTCVTFDPVRERVATTTDDGSGSRAWLWSLADGGCIELVGHDERAIVHAAFSPDGARLATSSFDLSTRLWNAEDGEPQEALRAMTMPLEAAWAPDGSRLVTLSNSARAHSWCLQNLPHVYASRGHAGAVVAVAFDPTGERALSASQDGTVRIWETPSGDSRDREPGRELLVFRGHSGPVVRAGFVRGGAEVLSASTDGTARRFSATDGTELSPAVRHVEALRLLEWSESADRAVTIDERGQGCLWRLSDSTELARFEDVGEACAFSAAGERFSVSTLDGSIVERRSSDGIELACWKLQDESPDQDDPLRVRDLAFDARTGELAVAGEWGDVLLHAWDRQPAVRARIEVFPPRRVEFSPTGAHLLVSGEGWGSMRCIDVASAAIPPSLDLWHKGSITATSFDPTGTLWLSAARDGSVFVWDVATCCPIVERPGGHGPILCAAFGPDRGPPRIVAGCEDGSVLVFPVDPLPAARARAPRELDRWEIEAEERLEERLAEPSRAR